MSYKGDIKLGTTLHFDFTTRQISGAPATLASSPVLSAYVNGSTTQITAGITLTVDLDGVTGLNHVAIVASGGNGYTAATDVSIVITTGTVNSVSVVGEVVGSFSIDNRPVTLADGVAHGGTLGSGTATLALSRLSIVSQSSNTSAFTITGNGTGHGISANGGSGATSNAVHLVSSSTNGNALNLIGSGTGDGLQSAGGATGHGMDLQGGATSGNSIKCTTTDGHALLLDATGSSKNGFWADTMTSAGAATFGGIFSEPASGVALTLTSADNFGMQVSGTSGGANFTALAGNTNGVTMTGAGNGWGLQSHDTSFGVTALDSLDVSGVTTFTGAVGFDSAVAFNSTLAVGGTTTFTGNVAMSNGLTISRSTSNTSALTLTGNGTGHGILATSGSGATGNGAQFTAASTNGSGLGLTGTGTGSGLLANTIATTGAVTFGSTFTVTTNFLVSGTATITGATTFTGAVNATNSGNDIRGIQVNGLTAAGAALFFTLNSTKVFADAVSGSIVKEIANGSTGGGGLTQQDVADAMKLAPTAGSPAAGSVQAKLDGLAASAGTGAFTITVTVTDGTDPLQNARVRVIEGINNFISDPTDVNGQAQFALDAATYDVAVTKDGYQFTPTTRTVTGNESGTLTNDLEMSQVAPNPPPPEPGMCVIYGYIRDMQTQEMLAGVNITVTLSATSAYTTLGAPMVGRSLSSQTNSSGYFAISVPKNNQITPSGTTYLIECDDCNFQVSQACNTDTLDIGTLVT